MAHVGISVCPGCGARFGVEAHAVGKALPCPACGVKFLVTPLPVATPVPPPPDPILDAVPRPPTTRTLEPTIYPRMQWLPDDVPWGVIAGIACVVVLGIGLYVGARYAYDAVQAALPPQQPGASGSVPLPGQPTAVENAPAASDDGVNAPSIAAAADRFVDRLAPSVTVPQVLPDTHARCTDDYFRLKGENRQLAEALSSGAKLADLNERVVDQVMRMQDLAIRWHALPPMTVAEQEAYERRVEREVEGGNAEPPQFKFSLDDDMGFVVGAEIVTAGTDLTSVIDAARRPPAPAANSLEEAYAEVCEASRAACRHLYAAHGLDDLDRALAAAEEQSARIKATQDRLATLKGVSPGDFDEASQKYALHVAHQRRMIELTGKHVVARYAIAESDGKPRNGQALPAVQPHVREFGERVSQARRGLLVRVTGFTQAAQETRGTAGVAESLAGGPSAASRLAALSAATPAGADLASVHEPFVAAAINELQRPLGPNSTVIVQVQGGTPEKRQHVERELVLHAMPHGNWRKQETTDGALYVIGFPGSVEFLSTAINYGQVTTKDDRKRVIAVTVP